MEELVDDIYNRRHSRWSLSQSLASHVVVFFFLSLSLFFIRVFWDDGGRSSGFV